MLDTFTICDITTLAILILEVDRFI